MSQDLRHCSENQSRGHQLKAMEKNCPDGTACSSPQGDAAGMSLVSCAAGMLHSLVLGVCAARSSSTSLLKHISFPHPFPGELLVYLL